MLPELHGWSFRHAQGPPAAMAGILGQLDQCFAMRAGHSVQVEQFFDVDPPYSRRLRGSSAVPLACEEHTADHHQQTGPGRAEAAQPQNLFHLRVGRFRRAVRGGQVLGALEASTAALSGGGEPAALTAAAALICP